MPSAYSLIAILCARSTDEGARLFVVDCVAIGGVPHIAASDGVVCEAQAAMLNAVVDECVSTAKGERARNYNY